MIRNDRAHGYKSLYRGEGVYTYSTGPIIDEVVNESIDANQLRNEGGHGSVALDISNDARGRTLEANKKRQ